MPRFVPTFIFFQTDSGNEYLFDDITGVVLQIPSEISSRIKRILLDSTTPTEALFKIHHEATVKTNYLEIYKILEILISRFGAFYRLPLEISQFDVNADELRYMILKNGLYELLLEVTNNCNFRCKYCVFGGHYKDFRVHGHEFMTKETALKAIDLYFDYLEEGALLNPRREPTIAFYGGEPLLNFRLIEECVNYVKEHSGEFTPKYTITTNGSLINRKIAEFLVKNDFDISISLDGPKTEHDRNRVLPNGRGTFDLVMRGISNLKKAQKKYGSKKEYFALVTYDPRSNLFRVSQFFEKDSPIRPIFINPVRPVGTSYYSQFTMEDYLHHEKMLRELFKKFLENNNPPLFLDILFGGPASLMFYRNLLSRRNPIAMFTSTCIPGFKLYITTKGKIQVCERAPASTEIGDINNGLEFSKMKALIREYSKFIADKCNYCNLAHSCARCFAYLGSEECDTFKRWVVNGLETAFTIYETNPGYFEKRLLALKERGGFYELENF